MEPRSKIILLGGGLDSTALLVHEVKQGTNLYGLFFDYGQKAVEGELKSIKYFCTKYDVPYKMVFVGIDKLATCSILRGSKVGLNPKENILEGRNAIFLTMAVTYACTKNINEIIVGFHKEPENSQFEDAKQYFILEFNQLIKSYLRSPYDWRVNVDCPFKNLTRQQIINKAYKLDPEILTKSFTCYEGYEEECGVCVHCKLKIKMLRRLNL